MRMADLAMKGMYPVLSQGNYRAKLEIESSKIQNSETFQLPDLAGWGSLPDMALAVIS